MNLVPWRIRSTISDRFPLFYHLAASLSSKRVGEERWSRHLADNWGWDDRRWPTKIEIIAHRAPRQSALIAIACGNGGMSRGLRDCGFTNLAGLETSRYAVERLREEGFKMFHGRLPTIPIADSHFDTAIASQVLDPIVRRHCIGHEISRIMKPEGQAFLFVPHDCLGPPIDEPKHAIQHNRNRFEVFLMGLFDITWIEVIKDANYLISVLLGHVRKSASLD